MNKYIKNVTEKELMKGDIIITEWYMYQILAMDFIAPDKDCLNKIETTPDDVIRIQKLEIVKNYENGELLSGRKTQVEKWLEQQEKSLFLLKEHNKVSDKMIDIKKLSDLLKILDEQENYIKKINYGNKNERG